ncbi:MAG: alpha/beta hydrolase-fold protein [Acidobacteriota bacterium]|nr:alpha/beta hydrolase-fold protein [Acidobacteriota bacterium]
MTLAIRALEQRKDLNEAVIDEFIENYDFPIVEDNAITFVFRGKVEEVRLQHWVYGLESAPELTRLGETDLWYLILDLPAKSRIEYKFDIVTNGKHEWVHDPFNPQVAHDPFGFNSVVHTPGYVTPDWTFFEAETRPGSIEDYQISSKVFGGERAISVYLPARFRATRRYPLLIVHDGMDYVRYAALHTVLDNLIHRLELSHMIVVFTQAVDRLEEYAADERHAEFIVEEVLPWVEKRYPIQPNPAQRGLMGASFGAVASLAAAWRYPGVFGRLMLQSGSFAFTDIGANPRGPAFEPVVRFMNAFRDKPGRPTNKIYMSCGIYESLIYENRSLLPMLQQTGMQVKYVEARDGHNWENWRDRLREGLSWLFPGPLWMVYE